MMRKELAMTHNKWLDHCCHILEVEHEATTDATAIALVRAKCLVQRIGERFSYDNITSLRFQSDAVMEMSFVGFKNDLAELELISTVSSARENCEWILSTSVQTRRLNLEGGIH